MHQAVMYRERRCSLVTRNPVAETVYNVRKHQELAETSPIQLVLTGGVSAIAWCKRCGGILEKPYVPGGEIPPRRSVL